MCADEKNEFSFSQFQMREEISRVYDDLLSIEGTSFGYEMKGLLVELGPLS